MNKNQSLYTAEQSRQLDRIAIEQCGIPGISLMKRAGRAAFQCLVSRWPKPGHITVFCGGGNNGGDGYIVAALAAQQQLPVTVVYLSDPERLKGDAALARDFARQANVEVKAFSAEEAIAEGLIVDALLGTGSSGDLRGDYQQAIEAINASSASVLSIDIPSGLFADTGSELGLAVKADATITFIGIKQGLLTGCGPVQTGELVFDDLGLPDEVYDQVESRCSVIPKPNFPKRALDAHKGKFGHVLVVGGDSGMGGAVLMAAEAAARCGAGLISVATRSEHIGPLLSRRPELMVKAVESGDDLQVLIDRASVMVIGPGLGQSDWSKMLLKQVLASDLPKVIDADALNLLASEFKDQQSINWVLTPHPGEAARLLACDTQQVQRDRFASARQLQQQRGGALVLKGVGSLVVSENLTGVCRSGNPGMASGGMGDVLSGVIGALLAQGYDLYQAASMGVQVHAMAADKAAQRGERGMLASDLFPHLRTLVNQHH